MDTVGISEQAAGDRYSPRRFCQNFTDTITVIVGCAVCDESLDDEEPLFPMEGRFLSVADLGLPAIEREQLLRDRVSQAARRNAHKLEHALAAAHKTVENGKKRKTETETEDRAPQTREKQEFTVHRHLVCANSRFFKAACSKLWAEGKEKIVRLPEVKVDAFQAYLVWVYTGKVVFNGEAPRHQLRAIIDLYLLGDVLDDLLLRNATMRTLVIHLPVWNVIPSVGLVNHIWASTPTGSPLRQVIIDTIVKRVGRASLGHCVTADHPAEFLHDIAVVLLKQVPTVSAERFVSGMNGYLEAEPSNDMAKST